MKDNIETGGPAFPFVCQGSTTAPEIYYGMTLRDYFAAKAMQTLLGSEYTSEHGLHEGWMGALAVLSYRMADAMMKARKGSAA